MIMVITKAEPHFNAQRCFLVIGLFGVITIISYFNELSKAGLLSKHSPHTRYRAYNSPDHILQRSARFNVDLSHVKQVLEDEGQRHQGKINLALHIGNNQSYEKVNSSELTVYQHSNTLRNYFLAWNESYLTIGGKNLSTQSNGSSITSNSIERFSDSYTAAVRVFVYQHEWGGYACRNCVKMLSRRDRLVIPNSPLNVPFRLEWDNMPLRRKKRFSVLYGSLSFGVCEKLAQPCNYFVMMPHPIDRILKVYEHCKRNSSSEFCRFEKLNFTNLTLSQFIRNQGSGFFKKLLYYSRRCRLVGEDEVCLKDAAFSFSVKEKQVLLKHVLDNLHKWFSLVGLVERYNESMQLFQHVFKQNFTSCALPKTETESERYRVIRRQLEKDSKVMKYLHADISIYNRFEEIFQQQLKIYHSMLNHSSSHVTTTIPNTKLASEGAKHPAIKHPTKLAGEGVKHLSRHLNTKPASEGVKHPAIKHPTKPASESVKHPAIDTKPQVILKRNRTLELNPVQLEHVTPLTKKRKLQRKTHFKKLPSLISNERRHHRTHNLIENQMMRKSGNHTQINDAGHHL